MVGSYHTELAAYAGPRSGKAQLEALAALLLGGFYGGCDAVLSPSAASDQRLGQLGIEGQQIRRWDRAYNLSMR